MDPLSFTTVVTIKQGFGAANGIKEAKAKSALSPWDVKTLLNTSPSILKMEEETAIAVVGGIAVRRSFVGEDFNC